MAEEMMPVVVAMELEREAVDLEVKLRSMFLSIFYIPHKKNTLFFFFFGG